MPIGIVPILLDVPEETGNVALNDITWKLFYSISACLLWDTYGHNKGLVYLYCFCGGQKFNVLLVKKENS